MEEELKTLIKVWVSPIISITYCYYLTPRIKAGVLRFLSILPVCAIFLVLPLLFSSVSLRSFAVFLTWFANFRLILFAFDQGPLCPLPPNLSQFICFTCLPIKSQQNPKSHQGLFPKYRFAIKIALFAMVLHLYAYIQNMPSFLLFVLYSVHFNLTLEIHFGLIKFLATIILGCALEPQFNEPYLATSLQDFWGRRWNLMITGILREAIYIPVRRVSERLVNSKLAAFIGVLASFLVSGLLHELIFFYITREKPTWEVTWFFVLHGVCTVAEVTVKRMAFVRRWQVVIPVVPQLLTVGFVVLTAGWLFFPQLKRSSVMERWADESLLLNDFLMRNLFVLFGII